MRRIHCEQTLRHLFFLSRRAAENAEVAFNRVDRVERVGFVWGPLRVKHPSALARTTIYYIGHPTNGGGDPAAARGIPQSGSNISHPAMS